MVSNGKKRTENLYPFLDSIVHAKKRAFLVAYCQTFSILESSKLAKVDRQSHYYWLGTDPDYLEAFRQAKAVAAETLESELIRRALTGVQKLKFFKGQPILVRCHPLDDGAVEIESGIFAKHYAEQDYSDVLGIFILKGAMPEKYRERFEHHDGDRNINDTIDRELAVLANRATSLAVAGNTSASSGNGHAPPKAS